MADRTATTVADLLDDLDNACRMWACDCMHHEAARTIRSLQAADQRKAIGARLMQDRLHDLLETALVLRRTAVHATDCPRAPLPAWATGTCTCGLSDALEAFRRLL